MSRRASAAGWILATAVASPALGAAAGCGEAGGVAAAAAAGPGGGGGEGGGAPGAATTGAGATGSDLPGFPSARTCAKCHQGIYDEWTASMHASSLTSPVTVAQTNQVYELELADESGPDPRQLCVNCHSPLAAYYTGSATLPFSKEPFSQEALHEGIGCVTCHTYVGTPEPGAAGLAAFQEDFDPSGVYWGPYDDPAPTHAHDAAQSPLMTVAADRLCSSCHNVFVDRDQDGIIEKGIDLVLQNTDEEYLGYLALGGQETCVTCHMPIREGVVRAADSAEIGVDQLAEAPPRVVRSHGFVGVDRRIDADPADDPQRARREELLRSAAQIDIDGVSLVEGVLRFDVSVANVGAGHSLPTGFAFVRQMWLEVSVVDARGNALFESGVLEAPTDDLCDASTLEDPSFMSTLVQGCAGGADPQLVSFQLKLVDIADVLRDEGGEPVTDAGGELVAVQAAEGRETWVQYLSGGAVTRARPADGQALAPIPPGQTRTFGYEVTLPPVEGDAEIRARLLFRALPPYFVRALAEGQPAGEASLAEHLPNIEIVEIDAREATAPQ